MMITYYSYVTNVCTIFFYNLAHDSRPNNDNSLSSQLPIFIVIRRSATYLLPLNNSVIAFYHLRDYT